MNALSNIASIVIERAHQAEARIHENIRQNAREIQNLSKEKLISTQNTAYQYNTKSYKVNISQAAWQKASQSN